MAWRPIIGGGIQIPAAGGGGGGISNPLTAALDAGMFSIYNLPNPTGATDAVPAGWATLANVLSEGNDANGLKIVNLADPSQPQDALTLTYFIDNAITSSGSTWTDPGGLTLGVDFVNAGNALQATNSFFANQANPNNQDVGAFFASPDPSLLAINGTYPFNNLGLALKAVGDQYGNQIDITYLTGSGAGDSLTVGGTTLGSIFSASPGNLLSAFAFDQNLTSNGSGEFGANAITLNNGPLAFGADTSGNLIIDGFFGGVGNDGIFFSTGAVGISGTFTMGLGVTTNGTITVNGGIITAVQEAS